MQYWHIDSRLFETRTMHIGNVYEVSKRFVKSTHAEQRGAVISRMTWFRKKWITNIQKQSHACMQEQFMHAGAMLQSRSCMRQLHAVGARAWRLRAWGCWLPCSRRSPVASAPRPQSRCPSPYTPTITSNINTRWNLWLLALVRQNYCYARVITS